MTERSLSKRFFAAVTSGDVEATAALLHPDFFVTEADGLPYAGVYRGVEGWNELARAVITTWKKFNLQLLELVLETEEKVVIRFSISGRSAKTGREFDSTVLEYWRLEDGRIKEIIPYYWDTHQLASINVE